MVKSIAMGCSTHTTKDEVDHFQISCYTKNWADQVTHRDKILKKTAYERHTLNPLLFDTLVPQTEFVRKSDKLSNAYVLYV